MPDRYDRLDDLLGPPDDDFLRPRRNTSSSGDRVPRRSLRCPSFATLMAYADEQDLSLSPRRRARIRKHVYGCEECFTHVEREIGGGVLREVHEMLKEIHDADQAATRRREENFLRALHAQSIKLSSQSSGLAHPAGKWLSLFAASLALLAIASLMLREATAVIHAETLIERAMAYERAHADEPRHVRQIRGVAMPGAMPGATPAAHVTITATGAAATHGPDLRHPLCAACYQAWRASHPRKRDTVTVTGDMYLVRTTTPEGRLREVTLMIHRHTYRLVRQSYVFEGMGPMTFEEGKGQFASTSTNQHASVTHATGDTAVTTLASNGASRPPAAGDLARTISREPGLSRWLDRNFLPSSAAARSTFLPDIERRTAAVRQHLVVLQRLASINGSAKFKDATGEDRSKLHQQVELEYQAVVTHLHELESSLTLLLGTGTRVAEFDTPVPADWEHRASTAMPHAIRLEQRLRRIFMFEDLPREETQSTRPRSARAAFEALWASIHGGPRE